MLMEKCMDDVCAPCLHVGDVLGKIGSCIATTRHESISSTTIFYSFLRCLRSDIDRALGLGFVGGAGRGGPSPHPIPCTKACHDLTCI